MSKKKLGVSLFCLRMSRVSISFFLCEQIRHITAHQNLQLIRWETMVKQTKYPITKIKNLTVADKNSVDTATWCFQFISYNEINERIDNL